VGGLAREHVLSRKLLEAALAGYKSGTCGRRGGGAGGAGGAHSPAAAGARGGQVRRAVACTVYGQDRYTPVLPTEMVEGQFGGLDDDMHGAQINHLEPSNTQTIKVFMSAA